MAPIRATCVILFFSSFCCFYFLHHEPIPRGWMKSSSYQLQGAVIRKDGNGRSSDLHPSDKRSSRKNVSDLLDACLFFPGGIRAPHFGRRCLQQRDCPGFSPDSLLIAVHPHSYSGTWRLRTNCGCKGKHKSRNNKVFL